MLKFKGTEEGFHKKKFHREVITNRNNLQSKQGGISNGKNFYLCHQETGNVITDKSFILLKDASRTIEKYQLKGFAVIRGIELLNYPDGWELLPGKKLKDFVTEKHY
jgi:hypothetical protein